MSYLPCEEVSSLRVGPWLIHFFESTHSLPNDPQHGEGPQENWEERKQVGKNAYLRHWRIKASTDIPITVFTRKVSFSVNGTKRQEGMGDNVQKQCARGTGSCPGPGRPHQIPSTLTHRKHREGNLTPSGLSFFICKIRILPLTSILVQILWTLWFHKAFGQLIKTILEIWWGSCPWARMVRSGSKVTSFNTLKVKQHLDSSDITSWDLFCI